MNKIAHLPYDQRKELFQQTAEKMPWLSEAAVEKDFWVCWLLQQLFSSHLKDRIIFKGGTSLSKVFHLIHRFSEDVDLILSWGEFEGGDPMLRRSNTKQLNINEKLDAWCLEYIQSKFLPEVRCVTEGLCNTEMLPDGNIVVTYPRAFDDLYLRPQILLEIGAKAAWIPHDTYSIIPFAAEAYRHIFDSPEVAVRATTPERSFWEKITILHAEAHRPENSPVRPRYSRHYYDTVMIARDETIKRRAFADLPLLNAVAEFKDKFYHSAWADYPNAKPGSMKLLPPPHSMAALRQDYQKMRPMIYDEPPSFDEILDELRQLETEINLL